MLLILVYGDDDHYHINNGKDEELQNRDGLF